MIANQKQRIEKQAAVAVSNREVAPTFALEKEASTQIESLIKAQAGLDHLAEGGLSKRASFGDAFRLLETTKQLIAQKLGVSEFVAAEMASQVLVKAEKIVAEYGGEMTNVIGEIVEQMAEQSGESLSYANGVMDLHPIKHNTQEIEEYIKNRLTSEVQMSSRDAETFKTVVYKNVQDLSIQLRGYEKYAIAKALVDLVLLKNDTTVIYNLKSSPTLFTELKELL